MESDIAQISLLVLGAILMWIFMAIFEFYPIGDWLDKRRERKRRKR